MTKLKSPLVSISCITYNHASFIRQCLDGFLMQKCNFEYEIVIHDDASTDGTTEIIKEYEKKFPNIIKPIYQKENQYSKGFTAPNPMFNYPRAKGKYIALCEGDDYWTDPLKLQKQVDFLEQNEDCSICWTKYYKIKENNNNIIEEPEWINLIPKGKDFSINLDNIFTPYCTLTCTCMFRKESLNLNQLKKMHYVKDNTLYALCLLNGNGKLLNFYSTVYRLHEGGVYSNASTFNQKYYSFHNINEIISTFTQCNNKNFKILRNFLLIDSLIYLNKKEIIKYRNLFIESIKRFGILKTLIILIKKITGGKFSRKLIS